MHPVRRLSETHSERFGGTVPPNEIRIRAENPGCERDEPGFSVLAEKAARRTFSMRADPAEAVPPGLRLLTKCGVQGDHPPAGVSAPRSLMPPYFVSVASVRRREGKRVPCGHLPPEVAKRPGAHRREASALWAVARSAKRPAGVSKYKGCARPARRTPNIAERQGSAKSLSNGTQETRLFPKPGVFQRSESGRHAASERRAQCSSCRRGGWRHGRTAADFVHHAVQGHVPFIRRLLRRRGKLDVLVSGVQRARAYSQRAKRHTQTPVP